MCTGARSRVSAATGVFSWFSFSGGSLSRSTTIALSQWALTAHEASLAVSSMVWIFSLSTGLSGSKKRMERRRPTTSLNSKVRLLPKMQPIITVGARALSTVNIWLIKNYNSTIHSRESIDTTITSVYNTDKLRLGHLGRAGWTGPGFTRQPGEG